MVQFTIPHPIAIDISHGHVESSRRTSDGATASDAASHAPAHPSDALPPLKRQVSFKAISAAADAHVHGGAGAGQARMVDRERADMRDRFLTAKGLLSSSDAAVSMPLAMLLGCVVQLGLVSMSPSLSSALEFVTRLLLPRWLAHWLPGSVLAAVCGGLLGGLVWLLFVQLALPVWRLHLKRRKVWPLSCEEIRLSDHRSQWSNWARGIDLNNDSATVAEEWGALPGMKALQLMESYQESDIKGCKFVCLRFFPTPPPPKFTSWRAYFGLREKQSQLAQAGTGAAAAAAPTATPMPHASPQPPNSLTSGVATPFTPYPDLMSLQTPGVPTPLPSNTTPAAFATPPDNTQAICFLTILPGYDLRPYLPTLLGTMLNTLCKPFVRRSAGADGGDFNVLSMRLGLLGFQFPFRSGVFFTRPLESYSGMAQSFRRQPAVAEPKSSTLLAPAALEHKELRTARHALLLQVLTDWNLASRDSVGADLLLHQSAFGSASAAATWRAHMLPVPVPPSYVADLREWGGASWSAYTTALRKQGKRVREAPFEKAGGTADFVTSPAADIAQAVCILREQVADKQAQSSTSKPTLIQPTVKWVEQLLADAVPKPSRLEWSISEEDKRAGGVAQDASADDSHAAAAADPSGRPAYSSTSIGRVLRLHLPQGTAASSVVFDFGPHLMTSDLAGFDYALLDEVAKSTGHKVSLYAVKLAHVLRHAMDNHIAYVDFGPTTGEAKRAVGCDMVPLHGAAICAQIHLLWLARAAASSVALKEFLSNITGARIMAALRRSTNFLNKLKAPTSSSAASAALRSAVEAPSNTTHSDGESSAAQLDSVEVQSEHVHPAQPSTHPPAPQESHTRKQPKESQSSHDASTTASELHPTSGSAPRKLKVKAAKEPKLSKEERKLKHEEAQRAKEQKLAAAAAAAAAASTCAGSAPAAAASAPSTSTEREAPLTFGAGPEPTPAERVGGSTETTTAPTSPTPSSASMVQPTTQQPLVAVA